MSCLDSAFGTELAELAYLTRSHLVDLELQARVTYNLGVALAGSHDVSAERRAIGVLKEARQGFLSVAPASLELSHINLVLKRGTAGARAEDASIPGLSDEQRVWFEEYRRAAGAEEWRVFKCYYENQDWSALYDFTQRFKSRFLVEAIFSSSENMCAARDARERAGESSRSVRSSLPSTRQRPAAPRRFCQRDRLVSHVSALGVSTPHSRRRARRSARPARTGDVLSVRSGLRPVSS
jgi:hypothetical protein